MPVVLSKSVQRALARSSKRLLLLEKLRLLTNDPASLGQNVTRMKGRPHSRLRVQDWRVIFRVEGGVVFVDDIAPRGSAYED